MIDLTLYLHTMNFNFISGVHAAIIQVILFYISGGNKFTADFFLFLNFFWFLHYQPLQKHNKQVQAQ